MKVGEILYAQTRAEWRDWLRKHYAKKTEIWIQFYKKHTKVPCVSYNDLVEVALCYGWIDSTVKRWDEDTYVQRITPRKPSSKWSDLNITRVHRMIESGEMTAAGRARITDEAQRRIDAHAARLAVLGTPTPGTDAANAGTKASPRAESHPVNRGRVAGARGGAKRRGSGDDDSDYSPSSHSDSDADDSGSSEPESDSDPDFTPGASAPASAARRGRRASHPAAKKQRRVGPEAGTNGQDGSGSGAGNTQPPFEQFGEAVGIALTDEYALTETNGGGAAVERVRAIAPPQQHPPPYTKDDILVYNSRVHNLQNLSVAIPKKSLVVFTGVSGSGKSSLVFDTICVEAQRQLIETFSAFQRRYLPKMSRPDADEIRNISPVIVIDQKRLGKNRRSTVGTMTEVNTFLRLLYSRCGTPSIGWSNKFSFNNPSGMCPACKGVGECLDVDLSKLLDKSKSLNDGAIRHQHYSGNGIYLKLIRQTGWFNMDKPLRKFTAAEMNKLLHAPKQPIPKSRQDSVVNLSYEGVVTGLRRRLINRDSAASDYISDAVQDVFVYSPCAECGGARICAEARSVKVNGTSITELFDMELSVLRGWLDRATGHGPMADRAIARASEIVKHLTDIGVGYLQLSRPVGTLSGGESQRVKMARQLGCALVDMIYICDEPTIGLHPRDVNSLLNTLRQLRDAGNTVLVVEHDPQARMAVIAAADHVIEIGPRAGAGGGKLMFEGKYADLLTSDCATGKALAAARRKGGGGATAVAAAASIGGASLGTDASKGNQMSKGRSKGKSKQRAASKTAGVLKIANATSHNLKNVTIDIPKGKFVCFTGVAGAGKSTLVNDCLIPQACPDAIIVDQSVIGRSSRSNPATYIGIFDAIRKCFAAATGKPAALFSFNSKGACTNCKGLGALDVEMSFLDNVRVPCEICRGQRYTEEVLRLKYKGKNISQVLLLTISEAHALFKNAPAIAGKLKVLEDVGLGYLQMGQALSTLSGGEAQRLKLACELHKTGAVYVMDEPSTGLHMNDCARLLQIVKSLVAKGNTVVVIEHNVDVIREADWIIDLGPEGGAAGGRVIAQGPPAAIAATPGSHTGQWLRPVLLDQ